MLLTPEELKNAASRARKRAIAAHQLASSYHSRFLYETGGWSRMASRCMSNSCQHFDGHACRLAQRIVEQLPTVVEALPDCQIRPSCRWWQQEGAAAGLRCPQMVTENHYSSEIMQQVTTPT